MNRHKAARILGISPYANKATIKKAFRKKAMRFHPDRNKAKNARSQFIEIHEAYEYLTDLSLGKKSETKAHSYTSKQTYSKSSRFRSPHHKHRNYNDPYRDLNREEFEERYNRAQRAAEEAFERRSNRIYKEALDEYQHTWRRKVAKFMAAIAAVLAFLFILDFIIGPQEIEIPLSEIGRSSSIINGEVSHYFEIKGQTFELPHKLNTIFRVKNTGESIVLDGTKYKLPLLLHKECLVYKNLHYSYFQSPIFKDIYKMHLYASKFDFKITDYMSVQGSFPIIPILLLIPLISLWFEKANFNFVFFIVNYNIYIVPLFILFLLLHDERIYRLFGL